MKKRKIKKNYNLQSQVNKYKNLKSIQSKY